MESTIERIDGVAVVKVNYEALDASSVNDFKQDIEPIIQDGAQVVLDLETSRIRRQCRIGRGRVFSENAYVVLVAISKLAAFRNQFARCLNWSACTSCWMYSTVATKRFSRTRRSPQRPFTTPNVTRRCPNVEQNAVSSIEMVFTTDSYRR